VRLEEKDAELKTAALALSKSRQDAMQQHNADMAEMARLTDVLYSKKLDSISLLRDGYAAPPAAAPAAAMDGKGAGKQSYQVRAWPWATVSTQPERASRSQKTKIGSLAAH
jgi:hypothetical protein